MNLSDKTMTKKKSWYNIVILKLFILKCEMTEHIKKTNYDWMVCACFQICYEIQNSNMKQI